MNINSNSEGQPKRQIVVCALLGWAGASPRHLQKYSTMVKQEWNAVGDLTCIESVMPVAYIFSPLPWPRRHWATELLESISETAAECDSPDILLYAFSNGGAFVVEQLCTLLQEPSNSRYETIRKGIRGIIFDSAPGYMHAEMAPKVIREVTPAGIVREGAVLFEYLTRLMCRVVDPNRQTTFWKTMVDLDWCPMLYLYSEDDHLCDASMIHSLVDEKRARGQQRVFSKCWRASRHCTHLMMHPEEYRQQVRRFFHNIMTRIKDDEIHCMEKSKL